MAREVPEKVDQSIIYAAHRYAFKGIPIADKHQAWQGVVSLSHDITMRANTPRNKTVMMELKAKTPITCDISLLIKLVERVVQDNFEECPNMTKGFDLQEKRKKTNLMLEILEDDISMTAAYRHTEEYKDEQRKKAIKVPMLST